MKSIIGPATAGFFVLAGNSAQAVDWNTRYNCERQYHSAQLQAGNPRYMRQFQKMAGTVPNSPERNRLVAHFLTTPEARAQRRDSARYCAARGQ
jgi:hypothetical protein